VKLKNKKNLGDKILIFKEKHGDLGGPELMHHLAGSCETREYHM
jgi:hypothetical protein